jgi:hypothetical protein
MRGRFLAGIAVTLAVTASTPLAASDAPERNIILTNSTRDLAEFRAFAKAACRMKQYGRVQIDIGVLASKAAFEVPPGGNEWHQYAAMNANLSKFFPHPKIAPFLPADWVRKNRELLLAKAGILREYKLDAAMSSNDTHYLPEAFFERYPHLRGPRVDHPRRSRREEFTYCVDLAETREMIEWMTAEARRQIPELKTILIHTNDSGTGLCWADNQYSGSNGPEQCRTRGVGLRVRDLAEAIHRGAAKAGGDIDIRIGGQFSVRELDEIGRHLPSRTFLSGRDPLVVGGHGSSDRDPTAMGVGTMVLDTYPVLGLINPLAVFEAMERFPEPEIRTLVLGTSLPWYYRGDERLETVNLLMDVVEAAIDSPARGPMARFRKLSALAAAWAGEANADRLFEALYLIDEAARVQKQIGRYNALYSATSARMINRPLLLRPESLTAAEESYFLPFIFNQSEAEARKDYVDIHGGRTREGSADAANFQRFSAAALQAASLLETIRNAPRQKMLDQLALSLRMWVSIIGSVRNFVAGQRIRDAHKQELGAPPLSTFKYASAAGDPDYFSWYQVQRRELDNTDELIRLLNGGGLEYFAHAAKPEQEDTFLFGPNLVQTLVEKRRIMRSQWLDAQSYLAPPHK